MLTDRSRAAPPRVGLAHTVRELEDVARRAVFLVDEGGTVSAAWAYEPGELPNLDEILAVARGS